LLVFLFQAEDGIRDATVTGVQTCALPICFSEMMAKGLAGPLQGKQAEYAQIIYRSGDHLLEIINEVLDLAKIDAGKAELNEEARSEERRVGKERRDRWAQNHEERTNEATQ